MKLGEVKKNFGVGLASIALRTCGTVRALKRRAFVLLITCVLTLSGCSTFNAFNAPRHHSQPTVPLPAVTEQDSNVWFAYYQDQFEAYSGSVMPPPETYPEAARQGYQRAEAEAYRSQQGQAMKIVLLVGGAVVVVGILLGSLATSGY